MSGRGNGDGCDYEGNVGWENPDGFEESRWETEDGADGGGSDGDDRLMASVEVGGEEAEDRSGDEDSDGPGN